MTEVANAMLASINSPSRERRVSFCTEMTVGEVWGKKEGNRKAYRKRDMSKKAIKQLEELNRELFPHGRLYGDVNCYDEEFLVDKPSTEVDAITDAETAFRKRHNSLPGTVTGIASPATDRRLSVPTTKAPMLPSPLNSGHQSDNEDTLSE